MDKAVIDQVTAYFKQQAALDVPEYIFSSPVGDYTGTFALSENDSTAQNSVREESNSENGYEAKRAALIELYYEVKNCTGCALGATRTRMVFGAGNAAASVMVIGEAPGYDEDKQGKPFVGKAGALLTKMLAAVQFDREKDVFITNILKCRPPENRNPDQTETLACMPILKRQIAIIQPEAILALGRIAAHELLNLKESIGKLRTETHNYNKIPVVVTYHPAALLRNKQYKRPAWEDLQKFQKIVREKVGNGSQD